MDFLSQMKSEIAKKSSALENNKIISANKRSFKRSELLKRGYNGTKFVNHSSNAKRARDSTNVVYGVNVDIIPKHVNVDDDDIAKTVMKADAKMNKDFITDKRDKIDKDSKEHILPALIVKKRLRERKEPTMLFGESDEDTYIRLRRLELEELGSSRLGQGYLQNDYRTSRKRQRKEEIEELLMREYNKGKTDNFIKPDFVQSEKEFKYDIKLPKLPDFVKDLLPKKDESIESCTNRAYESLQPLAKELKRGTRQSEMDTLAGIFKYLLALWGTELNTMRSLVQKKSQKGRSQTNAYKNTEDMIRPLFKMLETHTLQADITCHLADMIKHILVDRNYVNATLAYMQLAIGNSPWPLGITMTQIHVRPGHEKIKAKNVAHVFNDEVQRRFIQATKRLTTVAQRIWPCDPSKSVEFNGSKPEYDLLAASSVDNATAPILGDLLELD